MVAVPMLTLSQELPAKKLLQRNISISTSIIISTTIIIFKLMFIVTVISHFCLTNPVAFAGLQDLKKHYFTFSAELRFTI